ncbi:MAG: hypothetical protein KDC53_20270, partial [Saprospiraceae bacterium]|nr:hypothetical protein [Saprospiraceae bacterium]
MQILRNMINSDKSYYLQIKIEVVIIALCFFSSLSLSELYAQNSSDNQLLNRQLCEDVSFKGLKEIAVIYQPVPSNQGITNDGVYLYVSPNHSTIEKRKISNYELIKSAQYPDLIGGLFYDPERDEILTCSGEYETGGDAFISRINKNTLAKIETINISEYTEHGVNAIVRFEDKIYVSETAVNDDMEPKSWHSFDSDFNFIESVFSHVTTSGSFDWQDATVYDGRIY